MTPANPEISTHGLTNSMAAAKLVNPLKTVSNLLSQKKPMGSVLPPLILSVPVNPIQSTRVNPIPVPGIKINVSSTAKEGEEEKVSGIRKWWKFSNERKKKEEDEKENEYTLQYLR